MNYAMHKISLDIHEPESQVVLNVKQTDTGRKIKISLTEDGRPYVLTSDCLAIFKAKTPDGNDIKADCAIDGNTIIYTVSSGITSSIGENKCEIMLCNENGMLITSPAFSILVYGKVNAHGSILNPDSEASTVLNELVEKKMKNAVDKHFEENPINEITEEQKAMLDKLSVDEEGGLVYNGEPVGGRKIKTVSYEFGNFGFNTCGDYGDELFVNDDNISYGTEIKTVRFLYKNKWVDIRIIVDIDQMPYTLNMGVVYGEARGIKCLAQIGATIAQKDGNTVFFKNIIAQATEEFEIMEIEVDYYEN